MLAVNIHKKGRAATVASRGPFLEWSISRILCPFEGGDHLSGMAVTGNLKQPTRNLVLLR